MASGVPIVSTNVGMAKDFIVDGNNGGLVASFDPEEKDKKSLLLEHLLKPQFFFLQMNLQVV